MSAPLSISLVMPTYDEPERLAAALESLSRQDYSRAATQIIVVDDASPQLEADRLHAALAPF